MLRWCVLRRRGEARDERQNEHRHIEFAVTLNDTVFTRDVFDLHRWKEGSQSAL